MSVNIEMIAILDYSTSVVHIGKLSADQDVEDYMKENGFKPSECNWMIAEHITLEKCI